MPRPPSTTKRQQGAANHRDTRHENGLVGPGKRVQKQKSNGHLNGHAKSSESASSTPPLPATPPPTNGHARPPADNTADSKMSVDALRRASVSGYSESSSSESYNNPPVVPVNNENHRRIDVNAAKNPAVHRDLGHLNLALTVLRSCPLWDTIAILIVLLQIPPTFLSIIHLLFATLTFVPPAAMATSGLSFHDIFEGTLGTPSLATIIVVDGIFLLIWLFLFSPVQNIALDLAQMVIALTLGGGTSGREAGMSNVFVCFGVIGVSHFAHNNHGKSSSLRAMISSSTSGLLGSSDPDDPLEPVSHKGSNKGAHGWIRSILAIHILSQGVVRYIRDWYVRREKRDTIASIGDPEAAKGVADSNAPNPQPPDDSQANNVSITSKKRRKQSALVRIRQPLWAALASTKIVMVKEYETSHAAVESAGTNATDINNLGNAPFDSEADRIWITYVGSDSIFFATSFFPTHTAEHCEEKKGLDSSGIDKSKPFYVQVNKTIWQPTRINVNKSEKGDNRWEGEIFGLAPISSYTCDFVSTINDSVIFSTMVKTRQPLMDAVSLGGAQPSGRPGSPTTTLKTSIAAAEAKLVEERNRLKRERKDQRAKLSTVRKEIEKTSSNIASSGNNDDRLRQKVQQSNLHMKQAEDALNLLESQIHSLSAMPIDDVPEYTTWKAEYQSEKSQHKILRADFNAGKAADERDIQTLSNEIASLQQKQEKFQIRIAKLNEQHERLTDANAKGMDEAQRKAAERHATEMDRAEKEQSMLNTLQRYHNDIYAISAHLEVVGMEIQNLQAAEAHMYAQANSPTTSIGYGEYPENNIPVPSNYPWNPTPAPYVPAPYTPSLLNPAMQPSPYKKRGRSSSMLSNVSGFTQSSGEGPPQQSAFNPNWIPSEALTGEVIDRKDSSGSGSGSGSGSKAGSVGARSPIDKGKGKVAMRWGSDGT